jgi:prephenate dehydrogenase
MTSAERIAIVGTGLIGTSLAMAAVRAGDAVRGFDTDTHTLARSAERSGLTPTATLDECVHGATIVFVCTPIPSLAGLVSQALAAAPDAIVSDVGSVKSHVMTGVVAGAEPAHLRRYVGGHPMGGSERSGPDRASATVLDGAVWVLCGTEPLDAATVDRLAGWIERVGASPVRMDPERHDRLVAIVSHLPQVASTALMGLAATEEAGEPDILLLAAGGFQDLTRLAASSPHLWSDILLSNRDQIARALELYVDRLLGLRGKVLEGDAEEVERAFAHAKQARLSLTTKPQVKAGVAVIQVPIPDRPGVLADLASALGEAGVNIEDLQIVHSPEGGRGTVHLTVAVDAAEHAERVLRERWFEALRLA